MASFETLYQRHRGPIYRFLLRQLPDAQANDAFQEVWTKLVANIHNYAPQGKFQAYVFTLAHNALMDHHRQRMRDGIAPDQIDELADQHPEFSEQIDQQRLQHQLRHELKKLPINQRTVWIMRQETQLSLAEIARVTQTSLEGVKSRLRYANDKLQAGMRRYVES